MKKTTLIGGIVLILGLFVCLAFWVTKDDYQVLFAELDPQDAAQMVAELDRLKTPYKLADNGTTILVDGDAVYKTRLKLMGKGLTLKGNVGFELFNNTDYGTTEFAQKVNFQRALQGELARTIMAVEEIKHARVHLVLPERGLLKRQNSQAKASVSIAMKGAAQLSPEQVIGIQRLVAAAAPEMILKAVTVIDHRGVALTPNAAGNASGAWSSAKLEVKKEIESYLTKKVSGLLDGAIGPGKALVSIDVALNYDEIKITREDVLPTFAEPVTPPKRARVADNRTNVGPPIYQEESEDNAAILTPLGSGKNSKPIPTKVVDTDLPAGRRIEQIVSEPGNIRRISVGIFVPAGFGEDRLNQVREVVAMSVGLNPTRGDAIAVQSVAQAIVPTLADPAESSPIDAEPSVAVKPQRQTNVAADPVLYGLLGIAALLVVAGGIGLSISRRNQGRQQKVLTPAEREKTLKQLSDWVSATPVKKIVAEKR